MLGPDTEAVRQFLQVQPALSGFVLMGGSALVEELARFFCLQRDAFERSEAARAWKDRFR